MIVVSFALLIAAVAMVVLLRRSLTNDVITAAEIRGGSIIEVLAQGDPEELVLDSDPDEEFVQILGADGQVVASSSNVMGEPPMISLNGEQSQLISDLALENSRFVVVAMAAHVGEQVVVVGRSLESVTESTQVVIGLLVAGLPLLLLVVGVVTWKVVSRALAPVEAIRVEVEAIVPGELDRRVPDPSGDDEIARLARTMNSMLSRLEEGEARQRRFVSDASHELRSPISAIRQHAEVAIAHPEATDVAELAEVALEEDVRLESIVDDLMLLTRMDEGSPALRNKPVDLDDIVLAEVARLRSPNTHVTVDIGGVSAGRVSGDAPHLGRMVHNLVDNAARHARSRVAVGLHESDGQVVLTVDDDGDGVPPSDRDRVFDRFVRLDEARDRDSGGAGLGLSITREIAAAHGGTIGVTESPMGGARFQVRLPSLPD
jgi:signal transduction histidine kinase